MSKKIIAGVIIGSIAIAGAATGIGVGYSHGRNKYEVNIVSELESAEFDGAGKYKIGQEVELSAKDVEGYRFVYWDLPNGQISRENPYKFTLTTANYGTYTAVYEKEYTITVGQYENGTVTSDRPVAIVGEEVELIVAPEDNYYLSNISYTTSSGTTTIEYSNGYKFLMPEDDVTINATFAQSMFNVDVAEIANGSVQVSSTSGVNGTEITVSATAETGYELDELYYIAEGSTTHTEITDGTFTLTSDVTVYATFKAIDYSIVIPDNVIVLRGTETLTSESKIHIDDVLTISYEETTGYHKTEFTVEGATLDEGGTYIVGAGNVTITYEEEINKYTITLENHTDYSFEIFNEDGEEVTDLSSIVHGEVYTLRFSYFYDEERDWWEYPAIIISGVEDEDYEWGDNYYEDDEYIYQDIIFYNDVTIKVLEEEYTVNVPSEYEGYYMFTFDGELGEEGSNEIYDINDWGMCYERNGMVPAAWLNWETGEYNDINYFVVVLDEDFEDSVPVVKIGDTILEPVRIFDRLDVVWGEGEDDWGNETESQTYIYDIGQIRENGLVITVEGVVRQQYRLLKDDTYEFIYCPQDATSFEIPATYNGKPVTSIGDDAFADCYKLTSVTIPDSITTIGSFAFYGCNNLREIELPEGVIDIGESAFEGCSSLTSVTIPTCVTIGEYAFMHCTSLETVTFPEEGQVEIGPNAFHDCNLREITIPTSITFLGEFAFSECYSLMNVVLSEGITSISRGVFYSCENLNSITIPASVTNIRDEAFRGCNNVYSVTIDSIYAYTAATSNYECGQLLNSAKVVNVLKSIVDDENNTNEWLNGINWDKSSATINGKQYYVYEQILNASEYGKLRFTYDSENKTATVKKNGSISGNLVIPSKVRYNGEAYQVTGMASEAFYNCNITSVIIPSSITSIPYRAFSECTKLTSVTIPDSVTEIGPSAFYKCNFSTITIPEGVTNIWGSTFLTCKNLTTIIIPASVITIEDRAFESCESLSVVLFAEGSQLTSIGQIAFENCISLTEIAIPDSVTDIGYYAFNGCTSIEEINIPKNVNSIGYRAFSDCENLININADENNETYKSIDGVLFSKDGETLIICPEGKQGAYAIPEGVTNIGENAFSSCVKLSEVIIPEGVKNIGNSAFVWCRGLTIITIPASVTNMEHDTFRGCENLIEVTFAENSQLTSIPYSAFENCNNLTSVVFEEGGQLTSIEHSAFSGCNNLTSFTIPDGVTTIGSSAFQNCESLTTITIPSSVTSLSADIIYRCDNFIAFNVDDNNETYKSVNGVLFTKDGKTLVAYPKGKEGPYTIPEGVITIGESAFSGCEKLSEVIIPEGVTEIGERAFISCSGITSILIPSSVTNMGEYAFYNCDNIATVTFAENSQLTYVAQRAFMWCENLTSITIPSSVTSIGNYAFSNCRNLANIYFEEDSHLSYIGSNSFYNCNNITSIVIPTSVTSIGSSAFGGCYRLVEIYNLSSRTFTIGSTGYGYVAYYAKVIHTSLEENSRITTIDGVVYYKNSESDYIAIGPVDKNVTSVTLDSRTTSILPRAFYDCQGITSLTIPSGVTSIGESAFYQCRRLVEIYNLSSIELEIGSYDYNMLAYYAKDIYTSLDEESKLFTKNGVIYYKNAEDDYTAIGPANLNTTSITLDENTKSINAYAFYECKNLTTITIQESVTVVGQASLCYTTIINSQSLYDNIPNFEYWWSDGIKECMILKSIVDSYEFDWLDGFSWDKQEETETIDGNEYYVYIYIEPMEAEL